MQGIAAWLVSLDVPANGISLLSIGFATLAAFCFAETSVMDGHTARVLFALAAGFIQLRLLANLLDGMVAIGSGKSSPTGELYNDVPDRIADPLILVSAGFSVGGMPALGYVAALLAVFTAYVRVLGGSLGAKDLFVGPMAKPQRMATITAACVYMACAPAHWPGSLAAGRYGAMNVALALIVVGSVVTAVRRLLRIATQLRASR
jgi:phosphatidylglycerophosphate synthase